MSEQPQSQRHRADQDEPAHPEPSAPAAEHVAARYEVLRVTTSIDYETEGYFDSYDDACAHADELLAGEHGFGGSVAFEVLADRGTYNESVYEAS